jgi:hypothetical protein
MVRVRASSGGLFCGARQTIGCVTGVEPVLGNGGGLRSDALGIAIPYDIYSLLALDQGEDAS